MVSTKIIVTASHCVHAKKETYIRKAEEATFYIGKHNLEKFNGEQNYVVSGVSQFIIHPDWNYNDDKYDADITLAVLIKTVDFNAFVKPICLWSSTQSYEDIDGQQGIVAGWGKTQFKAISTEFPFWTKVPVVNTLTCIRSNDAFNQITSDRTFCGGKRNGTTGPCNGDSGNFSTLKVIHVQIIFFYTVLGGGFVFQSRESSKWYLRGIVSSSLYDRVLSSCDITNYIVFTDAAKFTIWIEGYIKTYG